MILLLALLGLAVVLAAFQCLMDYVAQRVAEDPSLLDDPEIRMLMRFVRRRRRG